MVWQCGSVWDDGSDGCDVLQTLSLPLLSSAHTSIHCPYISTCQEQKEESGENIPITPESMSGDLITPPTTTTHHSAGDLGCLVFLTG